MINNANVSLLNNTLTVYCKMSDKSGIEELKEYGKNAAKSGMMVSMQDGEKYFTLTLKPREFLGGRPKKRYYWVKDLSKYADHSFSMNGIIIDFDNYYSHEYINAKKLLDLIEDMSVDEARKHIIDIHGNNISRSGYFRLVKEARKIKEIDDALVE